MIDDVPDSKAALLQSEIHQHFVDFHVTDVVFDEFGAEDFGGRINVH